jgi:hypothetical protein
LQKLGVISVESEISPSSALGTGFKKIFDNHGDKIALQYGGSEAHHSNLDKKKNIFKSAIPELLTSVKRHFANNFLDP